MNIITISGRVTDQLKLNYTQSGKPVANGTMAVRRNYKNAEGEYESDFIDFCAWGPRAEIMANNINKGDFFGISGNLQTRFYENNEGKKVKVHEVNVADFDFPAKPKGSSQSQQQNGQQRQGGQQQNSGYSKINEDPFADGGQPIDIDDSDLPF